MSPPRAIVLAAGEGKRMRPLTANRAKPLLPVGGESLVGRLLRQLAAAGVEEATVVVGYREDKVREHVGDGSRFGLRVTYERQEQARGTGDAVLAGNPPEDEAFLFLNGDLFLPEGTLERFVASGPGTVAAAKVKDARAYGVWRLEGDRVAEVVEKSDRPPSDLANAGVYYAPAGFTRHLRELQPSVRGELELTDALNAHVREGATYRPLVLEGWLDVGRPWDLLAAGERWLAEMQPRIEGKVEDGATLHGPVHVGEGTVIKAGAYVEGPVYFGRDCVIGPNCYVRPNTVVLDDVKVGNAVEVKASLLMSGTRVGHLSYVGDSILGERVNFGAATVVANLRHDGKTVPVWTQGAKVDSGRRKLGVIVGDDVHTGINSSLNVGVVLGAGDATAPGEVVMRSRF